ncbi:MAG: ATP cone domain-containing protein [Actinobacteria bacterium]|nr:ATP cone domain-containing protein [Actinomycetota bacterium]
MSEHIIKSDGNLETFNEDKIISSLIKAGATPEQARDALDHLKPEIKDGASTDDIHNMAIDHLSNVEHKLVLKYSLKRAIMDMGPQGYVFEEYIAKILDRYGYNTQVSQILKGCCVDHEVDVLAKKDNLVFFIECKYHNYRGTYSDIKTALYVHARFIDIEKAFRKKKGSDNIHYHGWLVTNTKCTSDAIKYAECVKLKILAWQYPEVENLQYYIENKKLYPVSILTTITKNQKEILFKSGILLIQELVSMDAGEIMQLLSIDKIRTLMIINEIDILLS